MPGVTIAFGSIFYYNATHNYGQVKSSVDDLTEKQGTVRMRVVFVLRSAEVHPLFCDLFTTDTGHISCVGEESWKALFPPPTHLSLSCTLCLTKTPLHRSGVLPNLCNEIQQSKKKHTKAGSTALFVTHDLLLNNQPKKLRTPQTPPAHRTRKYKSQTHPTYLDNQPDNKTTINLKGEPKIESPPAFATE